MKGTITATKAADKGSYRIIRLGGHRDGEMIKETELLRDAIETARDYDDLHEGEREFLGTAIFDGDGNQVINY